MATTSTVIAIKVHFELITKDKLRRVIFGLEKDTQGTAITWKINFDLFEREKKTDPWGDAMVHVDIEVDKVLQPKAEKAALNGMTAGQQAHALGPAADDQKAAAAGRDTSRRRQRHHASHPQKDLSQGDIPPTGTHSHTVNRAGVQHAGALIQANGRNLYLFSLGRIMSNKNYLLRAFRLSLLLLLLGGSTVVLAQSPKPNVADASCDGIDLEKDGFSVRSS